MNHLRWMNKKWIKPTLTVFLCLLLFAPVTFIVVYASNKTNHDYRSLTNLQLNFADKPQYQCQLDQSEITQSIDTTVDSLFEQNKILFNNPQSSNSDQIKAFNNSLNLDKSQVDYAKKVAKDYVSKNFKDKKVPSYDNVDDYYLDQKMGLQTELFNEIDQKVKQESIIAKKYFNGHYIVFDTKKFNDFKVFLSWDIPVSQIIRKVEKSLKAALATTGITAVATIASLIISSLIPFLAWTFVINIGVLAFEYLLCSLVLIGTLKILNTIPSWLLCYPFRNCYLFLEEKVSWKIINWLTVAMRVCETLITLSENFGWIKLITNATDTFYHFILNN